MKNTTETIKTIPTTERNIPLDAGIKNIVADALWEMGYDTSLAETVLEGDAIDFSTVNTTRDIIDDLVQHYGESILSGALEETLGVEDTADVRRDHEQSWRIFKEIGFEKLLQYIIAEPIEELGLKMVDSYQLRGRDLTPELERVKRNLTIDYGEFGLHLPDVNIVVYNPKNQRVIAVISSRVTLREQITETSYWKLKLLADRATAHIKVYFVTIDEDETLTSIYLPKKGRAIVETDLDGTYVMTAENLEESDKVKLFEHFIEDLKQVIEENQ